jgi:hypothetical protein
MDILRNCTGTPYATSTDGNKKLIVSTVGGYIDEPAWDIRQDPRSYLPFITVRHHKEKTIRSFNHLL